MFFPVTVHIQHLLESSRHPKGMVRLLKTFYLVTEKQVDSLEV